MKDKKVMSIIIVAILILVILIVYIVANKNEDKDSDNKVNKTNEIVQEIEEGQKINTSEKMKETKRLGNIEISNIILNFQNNESQLIAKAKNIGSIEDGDYFIKITMVNEKGYTTGEVKAYIDKIEAGKEKNISIKVSADLVNAYDVKIERI